MIPVPEGYELAPPKPYEKIPIERPGVDNASGHGSNVSRGGQYFVGGIDSGFFTAAHAFRWSESGGLLDLGTLDPANNETLVSFARDISNDGSVVVGTSQFSIDSFASHAFRWTENGGMIDLGSGNGPAGASDAFGVSGDGNVVVGESEFPPQDAFSSPGRMAFRWSQADGMQSLGTLLGPTIGRSLASAITEDGLVIVGDSSAEGGQHGFLWTEDGGMVDLGVLPGDRYSAAMGVSDDGSIVVGISSPDIIDRSGSFRQPRFDRSSARAFYWTEELGMQDLTQLLVDAGDTTGVELVAATGISADGTWIGGITTVPDPEFPNLFVLDIPALASLTFEFDSQTALRAGDADQDLDFDQLDLIQVQIAAKYLSGRTATWGDGDWNAAPGGSPGNPPAGDGRFNQLDIIAAQQAGIYLSGPYALLQSGGQAGDGQTSVVYDATSGEIRVDAPAGTELTSINIDSASSIFTGQAAQNLDGGFDNDADANIFKATFGGSFGSVSFGNVAQPGLAGGFLLGDLTIVGSLQGGGGLGEVDLVYVPEPSALILLAIATAVLGVIRRCP